MVAEKYDINQLIERISMEQKLLLKQTNKWLKLKHSNKTIIAISNLTPLKEQIRYMLKKRLMLKNLNIY